MTPEQKKLDREYKRMLSVIQSATKGQAWIKPNADGYTDAQNAMYNEYQKRIDKAFARIAELKIIAAISA